MEMSRTVLDARPKGAQGRRTCWYGVSCIDEEEENEEHPEGDEDVGGARNCRKYVKKKQKNVTDAANVVQMT